MGPIDTIVQKFKLLKGGKVVRALFKEGLVDENGVATTLGRTLAKRLMAEAWVEEHKEELSKNLAAYAKISKTEATDED